MMCLFFVLSFLFSISFCLNMKTNAILATCSVFCLLMCLNFLDFCHKYASICKCFIYIHHFLFAWDATKRWEMSKDEEFICLYLSTHNFTNDCFYKIYTRFVIYPVILVTVCKPTQFIEGNLDWLVIIKYEIVNYITKWVDRYNISICVHFLH